MKVLSFGEILWDVINGVEHLGGAPFNFAAHIARCGHESFMVSRLGRDDLGKRAFQLSAEYGVDGRLIQWDGSHPTGIVDVTLTDGQPDYFIRQNTAYDYIDAEETSAALRNLHFDVFYFGSLSQRSPESAKALFRILSEKQFNYILYDVNLRKHGFTQDIIRKSLSVCSIFKLNTEEVPVISTMLAGTSLPLESFCTFLKSGYPQLRLIIITASEKGCYVFDQRLSAIDGKRVDVCDAVGAGDAFSASFMHVYAGTHDPVAAARVANQIGAFVASKEGPIPVYTPEIRTLLSRAVTPAGV